MTHSGNEPQLGGRPSDNAPMISSVQTRAIADLRGLYLVRDLDGLVERMSQDQQQRFMVAVVQQTLRFYEGVSYPTLTTELSSAIRAWLAEPGPANAHAVQSASRSYLNRDKRGDERAWWWLVEAVEQISTEPITTHLAQEISFSAYLCITDFKLTDEQDDEYGYKDALHSMIRQWQLDAAWAIVRGQVPPPASQVRRADLEAAVSDGPRMRREGNLLALLRLMDGVRQMRFRQFLARRVIQRAERALPPPEQDGGERFLIEIARRVLVDGTLQSVWDAKWAALVAFQWGHIDFETAHLSAASRAADASGTTGISNLTSLALSVICDEFRDLSGQHGDVVDAAWTCAVEVAWAILNDREPPPLEDFL